MTADLHRSVSWMTGDPITPDPGDRIDRIIARRAGEHPRATAVRHGDTTLSYEDLVGRADEIADALTACGVGASDVIAVQLPRSLDLVCTMLGVLRAGAIYTVLPLDWPVDRRRDVLRQTASRLCISRDADSFDCPQPMVGLRELLSGSAEPGPRHDDHGLGDLTGACCVFFTSGSTGLPKSGVAPHRGVIRAVLDPALGFGPSTVMLQAHSLAWDALALELWGPLLNGGTSVLRESEFFSHDDIRDAVRKGVNTMLLTPTVFNGAVTDDPGCLAGLTTVAVGGDRLSPTHIKAFLDLYPACTVFNLYGPVETTIFVTMHRITAADDFTTDLPIGTAVASTHLYLLDESRSVVVRGQVGEIAVAGDGVACGYLNNPEETAERFPSLPLGDGDEQVRVYLTGDLGRVDDRGLLHFEGRRDRQVKILGVRVEPREVERVVCDMPGVKAALAVPTPSGASQGLALIYSAGQDGPQPADIRRAVAAALPRPFVPTVIHRVDALPMNANGKTDVGAIAKMLSEVDGNTTAGPHRTPLTTLLTELEELTGVAASADSDVIELGLTSITALKLIGRIHAIHGVRVPMRVVFRSRTPGAVADWIARQ